MSTAVPPRRDPRPTPVPGPRALAVLTAGILILAGIVISPAMATVSGIATAAPFTFPRLSDAFDNVGASHDADPSTGDLDGYGHSLSTQDLMGAGWLPGTRITVEGTTFTWPDAPPGRPDNVVANGQSISMRGSGGTLAFLATSTDGTAIGSGTVVYSDGTIQPYTLTVPEWVAGTDDTKVLALPHWNTPRGRQPHVVKLYTATVPLQPARTVRTVVLPTVGAERGRRGPAMHVFASAIRPATSWLTGTWAASTGGLAPIGTWTRQTLRMVVHTSIGGLRTRLRFSNTFASSPVTIGHATVAVQAGGGTPVATPVRLTFGGRGGVTIPAGGEVFSDLADFAAPPNTNLLVSMYLPGPVTSVPMHASALENSFTTAPGAGDHTADTNAAFFTKGITSWPLLSGVDVMADTGSVVAMGDSITDGIGSTAGLNRRWPDELAKRLLAQTRVPRFGVLEAGISSNKLVTNQYYGAGVSTNVGGTSALSRFDRDVLAQTGVRSVIVLEGINDLKVGTPPEEIIAGLRQLAARAHTRGVRVIGATITPFKGWRQFRVDFEANRQAVNRFIRDSGGVFDAVVDFDAAVADPADPEQMLPAYDSGDHLHPSDVGYQAMAGAVDLARLG